MNIAGAVILYNPGLSVVDNIKSYLPLLKILIVYDNSEIKNELLHQQLKSNGNIVIIHDGKNQGIAGAINKAAKICLLKNYDWLLTMDQDSNFTNGNLEKYFSCIEADKKKETVAMYGINHETNENIAGCVYKEANRLITSGSMINLALFNFIGGFDEALFIDDVDTDYCYNAISKGYKIIKLENIFLNHQLGIKSFHTSLKTLKKTTRTLHSQERLYYMVRNYFYVNRKYKNEFLEEKKIRKIDLLNRIKNNFLYGKNRLFLISNVVSGWRDFKNNKVGKKI